MALLWQRQELDDTLHKRFMDAIFTNDIALLANTSAKAESQLHSLERTAGGIGLHVNSDKTEYMCFNQRDDVSTLNGRYLKLRDKFTYLGNIVSSTENNINTNLRRYGQLLGIWKSNQSDKIKRSFFSSSGRANNFTWTLTKHMEKKLYGNCTIMLRAVLNKSWRQHPSKQQRYGHQQPISKTIQIIRTKHAGHCRRSKDEFITDIFQQTPSHGRARVG